MLSYFRLGVAQRRKRNLKILVTYTSLFLLMIHFEKVFTSRSIVSGYP